MLMDLARRGIRLEVQGDGLKYYPRLDLTPERLVRPKAHKADVQDAIARTGERAAIMEFDAGQSRYEAERMAWREYYTS